MEKLLKAIIYCRVSSQKQADEGHGLDGQEKRCRDYAFSHNYHVVRVFREEGVSGGVIDRPAMQKLLAFLESSRDETIVIIDDIKRLARDVQGHFLLKTAIYSRNGRLESPSHRFEDSPEGKFVETVLAGAAELERNQNKKQVANKMKARLELGYWVFRHPAGFKFTKDPVHGKLLVRDEPKAGILKEALEGYATGRFPDQLDVKKFLEENKFYFYKKKERVTLEQIKRLLTQILYAGYIEYPVWGVTRRKGHHEALISLETYELIQMRLREKSRAPARKDIREDFPLRGFLLCTHCQKPITASWSTGRKGKKYPYYKCPNSKCVAYKKNIKKAFIEEQFKKLLKESEPKPRIVNLNRAIALDIWKKKMTFKESHTKGIEQTIGRLEGEMQNLLNRIAKVNNETVIRKYEERIEELEKERVQLSAKLKRAEDKNYNFGTALNLVMEFIKNPLSQWEKEDLKTRRIILKLIFAKKMTYERDLGFGTADFSLPYQLICTSSEERTGLVHAKGFEPLTPSV